MYLHFDRMPYIKFLLFSIAWFISEIFIEKQYKHPQLHDTIIVIKKVHFIKWSNNQSKEEGWHITSVLYNFEMIPLTQGLI